MNVMQRMTITNLRKANSQRKLLRTLKRLQRVSYETIRSTAILTLNLAKKQHKISELKRNTKSNLRKLTINLFVYTQKTNDKALN